MSDIAIRVENLGKMYRIGTEDQRPANLWQAARQLAASPFEYLRRISRPPTEAETLWALKDVSFEVKRGEVVGIIGRNGAGKSTLLRILSRITEPTHGRAEIHGRVGSLLEVGTGFHPELTGRENIYLNGAILGMKRVEIDRKFDEIVDFSGVERFLDTPVKRYSSGMYVRLAFAVAAHLEPEILLVDEVLAVGDAEFQKRCLGKMGNVAKEGRTVLFVSHNMSAVASLCPQTHWLEAGGVALSGVAGVVVDEYLKSTRMRDGNLSLKDRRDRTGGGALRAAEVRIEDLQGNRLQYIKSGQGVRFAITYVLNSNLEQPLDEVVAHLTIINSRDQRLFACMSDVIGSCLTDVPRAGKLVCRFEELPLVPGQYSFNLSIHVNRQLADKILSAASFQVVEGDFFGTGRLPPDYVGNILVRHTWQVIEDYA